MGDLLNYVQFLKINTNAVQEIVTKKVIVSKKDVALHMAVSDKRIFLLCLNNIIMNTQSLLKSVESIES